VVTASQIRAARALLGWSGADLAQAVGLSLQTIRLMESALGPGRSAAANVDAVQRALETKGVVFLSPDEAGGPGVRLRS